MSVKPRGRVRWAGVAFLGSTALGGFVLAPVFFLYFGIRPFEVGLFVFYCLATMTAITAGYHRLYAHAAWRAHPVVEAMVLFFGAAAFEQSALRWASLHRTHHRYVDTERDPYNITRGFYHAHMGWILSDKPVVEYDNVADLKKNRLLLHQHLHYQAWALASGLVLPLAIGLAAGCLVGTFLLTVAARLAVVHHSTFFINSFAHSFGTAEYDAHSSAKDNWVGALLTHGEGYHNYHHRFPSDYRNGIRWYHWDPTKWIIWALSKIGLASGLVRIPGPVIAAAKLEVLEGRRPLP